MTDEQIIKALECCAKGGHCSGCCPYDDEDADCNNCTSRLTNDALDLINRQKAEIERLQIRNKTLSAITRNYDWKFAKVKSEAIKEFAKRLCEDRVSNDPVVIAVKTELKLMEGKTK